MGEFEFDNFIIQTENKEKVLNEEVLRPHNVKDDKPSNYKFKYLTRHYESFKVLGYKLQKGYTKLTDDIFQVIEFVEVLKGFNGNKMDTSTLYEMGFFTAKVKVSKNDKVILSIKFKELNEFIQLDKLKAQILASKLSKVLSKVEA